MFGPLRILDLFAGIGGFSWAFESTSTRFKTQAFCEIDKDAQSVLSKHWPLTPIFNDVKTLNTALFRGRIEIICGGFPCQDISTAGKQRGLIDENGEATRSGLWFEYKRIIEEIRPRWVVIENVRNLLSNGLTTVLKDLDAIGYDAEWEIISAGSVGAPHLRERVWIVAYPRCHVSNAKTGSKESPMVPNAYDFRFWPAFTTEEEKFQWWAKATAKFRSRWETEPGICGTLDGLSKGMDRVRARRIKQLGNSIVPPIVEIIAKRILDIENEREKNN